MARAATLRDLDDGELDNKLGEARKELFNLRFQLATGRLDNISRIAQVRREIAQLLTVERERELSIDRSSVAAPVERAGAEASARRRLGRSSRAGSVGAEDLSTAEDDDAGSEEER